MQTRFEYVETPISQHPKFRGMHNKKRKKKMKKLRRRGINSFARFKVAHE